MLKLIKCIEEFYYNIIRYKISFREISEPSHQKLPEMTLFVLSELVYEFLS